MDLRIAAIAARQFGVFTRRQALEVGFGRRAIEHRLRAGRWQRVRWGVYRMAGALSGWRQDVMAACLATRGTASGRTAAALYGLAGVPAGIVEVVVRRSRAPRPVGIRVHRSCSLPRRDITSVDGIPCT